MFSFSWPKFRIQRFKYVAYQTQASECNSRTTENWKRLEFITVKCPVCVFRARLSAFEVSQLSSEVFGLNSRYVRVDESSMNPQVKEVLSLLLLRELREVFSVRGLFYVKCTLPLTRRTDNFVMIMAFNHPWLAMFYTHLLMLWASHIGCTWIESCVVVLAVLRLSRSFRVTLRRAWHFRLTFGICDHVTFQLGLAT